MSAWLILGELIGWIVLALVVMFAMLIVWAFLIAAIRVVRRPRGTTHIMSSKNDAVR